MNLPEWWQEQVVPVLAGQTNHTDLARRSAIIKSLEAYLHFSTRQHVGDSGHSVGAVQGVRLPPKARSYLDLVLEILSFDMKGHLLHWAPRWEKSAYERERRRQDATARWNQFPFPTRAFKCSWCR